MTAPATDNEIIDGELVESRPKAEPPAVAGSEESDSRALATTRKVIYDADAPQRVTFRTERHGRLYLVTHIFGPLKDDAILDYERQRSQKLSDASADESDDNDATAVTSSGFQAAVNYWHKTQATAEGYAGKINDRDKAYAVGQLFGVEFQPLPMAQADELCPDDDDENSVYVMRSLFDGRECYTQATLRPATSEEIQEFEALMARALLVQGTRFGQRDQRVPAKSKRLGEMFDAMKVDAQGYARRVPLHHKAAFALRHLRSEQELIVGN